MKKVCYRLDLSKDFEGMDIRFSLHKDLTFDSLDEALKVGRMYSTELINCEITITEVHTELLTCTL